MIHNTFPAPKNRRVWFFSKSQPPDPPCTSAKDPKDAASRSATFGTSIFRSKRLVVGGRAARVSLRLIYAHPTRKIGNPHGYKPLLLGL